MDAAELRGILRDDTVGLVLGVLIVVPGLLILGLVCLRRQRAGLLLWPGVFALLYGSRLLFRTSTFRLYFDLPPRSGIMRLPRLPTPSRFLSSSSRAPSSPRGVASGPRVRWG